MTSTSAGKTPENNASGPSSLNKLIKVAIVDGFLGGFSDSIAGPGRSELEDSDCRAVMRVLTTQIGFVISTVALPAMAPAIMDSRVVSFWEARVRRAAREKNARVHSYP